MTWDVNDVMHRKRARRIWGILKKVSELSLAVLRRKVTFACSPRPCGGCRSWWGGRWKSHHRKIVHFSSLCRNLLFKGNKRFRTWTKKSLRVFRVSGFLYSMYICYEHFIYISRTHIWLWYSYSWRQFIFNVATSCVGVYLNCTLNVIMKVIAIR